MAPERDRRTSRLKSARGYDPRATRAESARPMGESFGACQLVTCLHGPIAPCKQLLKSMANYYGKSPLRMMCPHCGAIDEHRVIRTDTANYYCGHARTAFFERIAGRDIRYRERLKRCKSCNESFGSIETPSLFLNKLMEEVTRLENAIDKLRDVAAKSGKRLLRAAGVGTKRRKAKRTKK